MTLTGPGEVCQETDSPALHLQVRNQPQARHLPPPMPGLAHGKGKPIMLAVLAAIFFGIGFIVIAFIHATVPAAIVPGFLYLGLFCLALHALVPYTPWRSRNP